MHQTNSCCFFYVEAADTPLTDRPAGHAKVPEDNLADDYIRDSKGSPNDLYTCSFRKPTGLPLPTSHQHTTKCCCPLADTATTAAATAPPDTRIASLNEAAETHLMRHHLHPITQYPPILQRAYMHTTSATSPTPTPRPPYQLMLCHKQR